MNKIEPGKYLARVKDYGLVTSKNGAPQVKVEFSLEIGGIFSYFGNLGTEDQQKYTTNNLVTLGATPSNIDKVENGLSSNVLNTSKLFELVIETRQYKGKEYTQIKYINDPSNKPKAQEFLKGTNALSVLKGQAAQIVAEKGLNTAANKPIDNVGF